MNLYHNAFYEFETTPYTSIICCNISFRDKTRDDLLICLLSEIKLEIKCICWDKTLSCLLLHSRTLAPHSPAPRRRELDYLSGSRTPLLRSHFKFASGVNLNFIQSKHLSGSCILLLRFHFKFKSASQVWKNLTLNLKFRLSSKYTDS